ncbi:hypothetical protein K2O51_31560 (plasmid) [Cupriavidus pinatubonensis]|uniref:hypothetical protein n=1 Tax=Cupriavidus pinatubonensis TaxID=248026 RepID=UPI001C7335B4|nr:hypothetical protein [Cupriavidus pinatubonensis]QYY33569.1 hypothetical protein K2O51_31560 [Cupriavidus pinatubonensis]
MALHDCQHTFENLASTVLPQYMDKMREAMFCAEPLSRFAEKGVGVKTLLKRRALAEDFPGCYVMLEAEKPLYVGISRSVIGRLRQHVTDTTHYGASLAYRIAASMHREDLDLPKTRSERMMDPRFASSFAAAQERLRATTVAYLEIGNPLELYVFEAYCALELDTGQFNSFETH